MSVSTCVRKPDFFIVGAAKSGTTSLYRYVRQRPDVYLPSLKGPRFFVDPGVFGDGRPHGTLVRDLDEYLALFADAPEHAKLGEASPVYLYSVEAADRIREFNPDARIIAILRNSVDRAYSLYWLHVRLGIEDLLFEEAIAAEEGRPPAFHCVQQGSYTHQLRRYLDRFGEQSVAVFFTDDLREDAAGLCGRLFKFLQVDPDSQVDTSTVYLKGTVPRSRVLTRLSRSYASPDGAAGHLARRVLPERARRVARSAAKRVWLTERIPRMREQTRQDLVDRYREDVAELGRLTGRYLSHWARWEAAPEPCLPSRAASAVNARVVKSPCVQPSWGQSVSPRGALVTRSGKRETTCASTARER